MPVNGIISYLRDALTGVLLVLFITACTEKPADEGFDFELIPVQAVDSMCAVSFQHEDRTSEMMTGRMERYSFEKDSMKQSYELYLNGFCVKSYTCDGELETRLDADEAKHITTAGQEKWMAYGNVVIVNYLKGEKVETDTVWWNKEDKTIYTHNYVKMESEQGFVQGYGMTTDENARNTVIHRPFDSFGYVERDSTNLYRDTMNFIGPLRQF